MSKPHKSLVLVVKRTIPPDQKVAKKSLGVANFPFEKLKGMVSKKPSRKPSR